MKELIFKTRNDWTGFAARFTTGLILFPHGAQKMLGLFGGYGYSGSMGYFTGTMQLPWIVAFMVIIIEFVGSLSLIAGFASRIWAVLNIVLMCGIILSSHLSNGFFMNWFGNQAGEGFEFHLLFIGLSFVVMLNGSGRYAIDGMISKKSFSERESREFLARV